MHMYTTTALIFKIDIESHSFMYTTTQIFPIKRKAKKDGKKGKQVRDTLFIDGEVFTETLMDPRVDSQTYSQKNPGYRRPKQTPAPGI